MSVENCIPVAVETIRCSTDLKLYVRDSLTQLDGMLAANSSEPSSIAVKRTRDVVLPGFTHLQRAQPVMAVALLAGLL